jgi:hypothetical protein
MVGKTAVQKSGATVPLKAGMCFQRKFNPTYSPTSSGGQHLHCFGLQLLTLPFFGRGDDFVTFMVISI